jgi:uncharacterized protein (DUF983 family)
MFPILLIASEVTVVAADPIVEPTNKFLLWFGIIVTVLLGISEALAAIPSIKANAIYQLITNILKAFAGKK